MPARFAGRDAGTLLEREIREQALELSGSIATTPAQVDEATRRGIYPLLLRSESIASSRIERVDASGRDVSYTQLDEQQDHLRDHEALSVARNVLAARTAIEQLVGRGEWWAGGIEQIHRALGVVGAASGMREVGVWIGG